MRVAERRGWILKRVSGDHYLYGHPEFRHNLPIADHRELRPGTLRDIIARFKHVRRRVSGGPEGLARASRAIVECYNPSVKAYTVVLSPNPESQWISVS